MRTKIEAIVTAAIVSAVREGELALEALPDVAIERPREASHGDWACTVAMRMAKTLKRPPREIAELIAAHIATSNDIAAVEIAGPGFINLRLSNAALQQVAREARSLGCNFARMDIGAGQHLNIEFVSANPTGPMHIGHGRWAALGNAMCNVAEHAGYKVTREFYINDAGHQMDVFGRSIVLRYLELCGQNFEAPEEFYGGAYVIDIARCILDEEGEAWLDGAACDGTAPAVDVQTRLEHFRERGLEMMLGNMKGLCESIGVHFDVWFSERTLYLPQSVVDAGAVSDSGATGAADTADAIDAADATDMSAMSAVEHALKRLDDAGYIYQKDDATWFKSSVFGDDKDRVLIKADGSYTYFAPDIAYHLSKYDRGADELIDIWGADHHGYVPRMRAATEALGHAGKFRVVLGQLVNLFRNGEAVRMSKRTGEMITFEELIDEVGADATKYLMLSRSTEQAIDFDIEVAKKQDASNPVYYVQYAHARICSILRKAEAKGITANQIEDANLSLLVDVSELDLCREFSRLSEVVEGAARDLAPFRLTHYAEALATGFHSFYTRCKVITDDEELTCARLYLADAARSVLALVLSLLGVSAPQRM